MNYCNMQKNMVKSHDCRKLDMSTYSMIPFL